MWQEQRERLETQDAFVRFNERLHREWAIETGRIERLYAFDRGVTQLLIERGIDAALIPHGDGQHRESVAAMSKDHHAAVESVFRFVKGERPLSAGYVKEMHALMTRNQAWAEAAYAQGRISRVELTRGDYKRWPDNPLRPDGSIHEYCPPVRACRTTRPRQSRSYSRPLTPAYRVRAVGTGFVDAHSRSG